MPLPIVYPKRKKWYSVKTGRGRAFIDDPYEALRKYESSFENPDIRRNVINYVKLNRRKYYEIGDFDENFFDDYEDVLQNICYQLSLEATQKLQELIEERGYVEYTTGGSKWYHRTYRFPTAFNVFVWPTKNSLSFQVAFFYETLYTSPAVHRRASIRITGENEDVEEYARYRGQMARYLSIYGVDVRKDLPDILNTPVTTYESQLITDRRRRKRTWYGGTRKLVKTGKREGRWYQEFDNWFRTEGYSRFLELCEEEGLL